MKMHRIVTYVLDFEDHGVDSAIEELESMRHTHVRVGEVQTAKIGKWDDDHVLNKTATTNETFDSYFT